MGRRIGTRNAAFQQWQALLGNRTKRGRAGEFLVQGVRPISLAVRSGWPVRALLHAADGRPSDWARSVLAGCPAEQVALAPELLRELGDKADEAPEIVAVVGIPADSLDRIPLREDALIVVFDRPSSPGNLGTVLRAADAFGAHGVVVTGHAADPYDPKAVRASTGSLFAVPTVRVASHTEVLAWCGAAARIVGTDEAGAQAVSDVDLAGPTVLVIGNETRGMSAGWRSACDELARIPIGGSASSLNAATAAGIVLYEATRQRTP